jgi:opacity protein-like surface antigen
MRRNLLHNADDLPIYTASPGSVSDLNATADPPETLAEVVRTDLEETSRMRNHDRAGAQRPRRWSSDRRLGGARLFHGSRQMRVIGLVVAGILMVVATAGPGFAEIETGLSSLTTAVGVYTGAGTDFDGGGSAFGISGMAEVAKINEKTTIELGLLWFSDGSEYTQTVPGIPPITTTAEASFRDISVLTGGRYHIHTSNESLEPYLNGGLEIAFWKVSSSVRSDIFPELETSFSDTDLGIYVGGGTHYRAGDNLLLNGGLGLHTAVSGFVSLNFGLTYLFGH